MTGTEMKHAGLTILYVFIGSFLALKAVEKMNAMKTLPPASTTN